MILILEVTSPPAAKLGGASRQRFQEEGGSIGRESDNSWVLPDPKVSGHHAEISYRGGVYYIEDASRNGTYLINASKNRLARGRPYALTSGDRILIDPYEIRVSITRGDNDARNMREPDALASVGRFDASDPFDIEDPFAPRGIGPLELEPGVEEHAGHTVDPLELLGLAPKQAPARKAPSVNEFERDPLLDQHYRPPAVVPDPALQPRVDAVAIPQGYNPLGDDSGTFPVPPLSAPPPDARPAQPPQEERAPRRPMVPVRPSPAPQVAQSPRGAHTRRGCRRRRGSRAWLPCWRVQG